MAPTKADQVIEQISKIDYKKRSVVEEITFDMVSLALEALGEITEVQLLRQNPLMQK